MGPILAADDGELVAAWAKWWTASTRSTRSDGAYVREQFFNSPKLHKLVRASLRRADPRNQARRPRPGEGLCRLCGRWTKGRPTVILAKTIKGYGLGEAGEGRNVTHNNKKLNEEQLKEFRTRFSIPLRRPGG